MPIHKQNDVINLNISMIVKYIINDMNKTHLWHIYDTLMTQNDTKMTWKWHQIDMIMTPKWHLNDIKMTQKWHKIHSKITWKWHKNDIKMTLKSYENDIKQTQMT